MLWKLRERTISKHMIHISLIFAFFSSCFSRTHNANNLSVAKTPMTNNIAVVFSSDPWRQEVGGVNDLKTISQSLLRLNENWDVRQFPNAGKAEMLAALSKATQDLAPDGTLLFFFSGHGVPWRNSKDQPMKWSLLTYPGHMKNPSSDLDLVYFDEIFSTIQQKTPFSRLIMIIDACYSGGMWQTELQALPAAENLQPNEMWLKPGRLAHSSIFVSSSIDKLKSRAISKAIGGVFTIAFATVLEKLWATPGASWGELLEETKAMVDTVSDQKPLFSLWPNSLGRSQLKEEGVARPRTSCGRIGSVEERIRSCNTADNLPSQGNFAHVSRSTLGFNIWQDTATESLWTQPSATPRADWKSAQYNGP